MSAHLSYEAWQQTVRATIIGSTIARYAADKIRDGRGGATAEDVKRWTEEAGALCDLYDQTSPP